MCQLHLCSDLSPSTQEIQVHVTLGDHQKKLSAVRHRQVPSGLLQAGRHTNFATFSKIQWKRDSRSTMDSLQKDLQILAQAQATRPNSRPPGPAFSKTPRFFSWCRFATSVAHFSEVLVQMTYGLIQIKFLNLKARER